MKIDREMAEEAAMRMEKISKDVVYSAEIYQVAAHALRCHCDLVEALELSLGYIEAVCFNTPSPAKRKDYAAGATKIRAVLARAKGEQ